MATMSAMTPQFIRMSVGPALGSTGEGRRASLDPDARRPVPLLVAVHRCRHDRRQDGPPHRGPRHGPVAGDQDIDVLGSHNGAGRPPEKVRGPVLHRDMVRLGPGAAGHGKAWRGHLPRVLSS